MDLIFSSTTTKRNICLCLFWDRKCQRHHFIHAHESIICQREQIIINRSERQRAKAHGFSLSSANSLDMRDSSFSSTSVRDRLRTGNGTRRSRRRSKRSRCRTPWSTSSVYLPLSVVSEMIRRPFFAGQVLLFDFGLTATRTNDKCATWKWSNAQPSSDQRIITREREREDGSTLSGWYSPMLFNYTSLLSLLMTTCANENSSLRQANRRKEKTVHSSFESEQSILIHCYWYQSEGYSTTLAKNKNVHSCSSSSSFQSNKCPSTSLWDIKAGHCQRRAFFTAVYWRVTIEDKSPGSTEKAKKY